MQGVQIVLDVDTHPPLRSVPREKVLVIHEGIQFCRVPKGMESGASAVGIIVPLPDGQFVYIETSMALFEGVASAFRAAESKPG